MSTLAAAFGRLAGAQAETRAIVLRVQRTCVEFREFVERSRECIAESQEILRRVEQGTGTDPVKDDSLQRSS